RGRARRLGVLDGGGGLAKLSSRRLHCTTSGGVSFHKSVLAIDVGVVGRRLLLTGIGNGSPLRLGSTAGGTRGASGGGSSGRTGSGTIAGSTGEDTLNWLTSCQSLPHLLLDLVRSVSGVQFALLAQ